METDLLARILGPILCLSHKPKRIDRDNLPIETRALTTFPVFACKYRSSGFCPILGKALGFSYVTTYSDCSF